MLDLEDLHRKYIKSIHYYFALPRNRIRLHLFRKVQTTQVEWIVMMEDLFKSFHSNSFYTFDYC